MKSNAYDLIKAAAEWFRLETANTDVQEETIKSYLSHVRLWFKWCKNNGIKPIYANTAQSDFSGQVVRF